MINTAPVSQSKLTAMSEDFAGHLISLVASRLCHDLVSPLGAIGNGIELMHMMGTGFSISDNEEIKLIEDALHTARTRINYFRIAFGPAGSKQRVSQAELSGFIADAERAGRMRIQTDAPNDHARSIIKLVLLSLMCLEAAMPWGAEVTITEKDGKWCLSGSAERTRHDPVLWQWLNGHDHGSTFPEASGVQFVVLGVYARQINRSVRWSLTETSCEIRF